MNEEYYKQLEDKLKKSCFRARNKYPHNTQLQLTDKQLEDLLWLWINKAKEVWTIDKN